MSRAAFEDVAYYALVPVHARYTVWGCPLMTRVGADHPFFANFTVRPSLVSLTVGQEAQGRCGRRVYVVQRVA